MTKFQDAHAAKEPVGPTQINESEGNVWHKPTLSAWKVDEETLDLASSGGSDIAG